MLTEATQARLTTHTILQDSLTDELVGLAQQLKHHARAYEGALKVRDGLVDQAENLVMGNVARTQRATTEANKVHRKYDDGVFFWRGGYMTTFGMPTATSPSPHTTHQNPQTPHRNKVNFCTTCLVLILVGMMFAGMYMFIKVTSFAGFSAAKTRIRAAARQAAQKQRQAGHVDL